MESTPRILNSFLGDTAVIQKTGDRGILKALLEQSQMITKTMPHTAVLYVSHLVTPGTLWNYIRIRRALDAKHDLWWVCQGGIARRRLANLPVRTFEITDDRLKPWRSVMNGNGIVPGNGHIPTLLFERCYQYERYWFIEYDVRFTGNWQRVFDLVRHNDADLISSFLTPAFSDESWYHWDTVELPFEHLAYSFNPVRRVSHRLLKEIERVLNRGWWAHHEVLLASICKHQGWMMCDFNRLAEEQWDKPIYTPTNARNAPGTNAPGTLSYRPAVASSLMGEREKLYHPVKPLRWYVNKFGRRNGVVKAVKSVLSSQNRRNNKKTRAQTA